MSQISTYKRRNSFEEPTIIQVQKMMEGLKMSFLSAQLQCHTTYRPMTSSDTN